MAGSACTRFGVLNAGIEAVKDPATTIEPHLSPTAIVSSNTSTLPLESLLDGVPESLRERFAITQVRGHVANAARLDISLRCRDRSDDRVGLWRGSQVDGSVQAVLPGTAESAIP